MLMFVLYSVDMFIPFYTGKIIDILGHQYQATEFTFAVLFMAVYSIGRYESAPSYTITCVAARPILIFLSLSPVDQLCERRLQRRSAVLRHLCLHLQDPSPGVWGSDQAGSGLL